MRDGEEAVAALLDVLNAHDLDYMVVGSFSSNRYGVPRATKDADFVLSIANDERARLFSELPPSFKIDPQVSFEMVTGTWRQIITVPEIPFTIELFELSRDEHDQARFSRRRKSTLIGKQAWIPTPEDVVIQKLRWCVGGKRSKDFEDVVAVLGVQGEGKLDWEYIRGWCEKHGTTGVSDEAVAQARVAWDAVHPSENP
ncbi:MAG: hypothetical protein V4733_02850 [Verrucomicrobiota bacterium]